jgi:hypothetical protein
MRTKPATIPIIVGVVLPEAGRVGVAVGTGVTVGDPVTVGVGVALAQIQLALVVQDGFLQTPT